MATPAVYHLYRTDISVCEEVCWAQWTEGNLAAARAALIGFSSWRARSRTAADGAIKASFFIPPPLLDAKRRQTTGTHRPLPPPTPPPLPPPRDSKCNSTHPQFLTPYPHVSLFDYVVEVGSHGEGKRVASCSRGKIKQSHLFFSSFFYRAARCVTNVSLGETSSGGRAGGGQPAPVSALRLPGVGGAIHPRAEGDTIRQLIHFSRRGEQRRRAQERRVSWTTPSPKQGGGWGISAAQGEEEASTAGIQTFRNIDFILHRFFFLLITLILWEGPTVCISISYPISLVKWFIRVADRH